MRARRGVWERSQSDREPFAASESRRAGRLQLIGERQLRAPSSVMRPQIEDDRRPFFDAMAKIRGGMLLGPNKNLNVEPIVWAFEWAQKHYMYAVSN